MVELTSELLKAETFLKNDGGEVDCELHASVAVFDEGDAVGSVGGAIGPAGRSRATASARR